MTKKGLLLATLFFAVLFVLPSFSQSLTQMGFIIKNAIPDIESIAIIALKRNEDSVAKNASKAQLITRLKYHLYTAESKSDILGELRKIYRLNNVAILIQTNNSLFNEKTIKYIALKVFEKKIPLITDRQKDTFEGAMITIIERNAQIESHISKIVTNAYGIDLKEEFLAEAIVDVE